jgi:hypothetical protein
MKLKFKNTTLSPRAIVYKRYTDIEKAFSLESVYQTIDSKLWVFNADTESFEETNFKPLKLIQVGQNTVLGYKQKRFSYSVANGWGETDNASNLAVKYGNIANYQINQYFLHGTFAYVRKGKENEVISSMVKGAYSVLHSFDIQHYNDFIDLTIDDLVVVDNRLYKIESIDKDHKHQPKDFTIYYATLTSIL